jgi:hypothetical protein
MSTAACASVPSPETAWHAGVVDTAPEQPSELRRWLERVGLEGAEVLAVLDNADLDQLNREGVRLLHGLLEARWQLEHPEELAARRRRRSYSESRCGWLDSVVLGPPQHLLQLGAGRLHRTAHCRARRASRLPLWTCLATTSCGR